jgi:hypothetical protein
MLQEYCMLGAVRRQFRPFASTAAIVAALLLAGSAAWAQDTTTTTKKSAEKAVRLLFTIPVPVAATNTTGGMYGFDISWVDQTNQTYYLGDRSNAAVDAVNAKTGTFIQHITATPPFAGATGNNSTSGPNGVTTDGTGTCLFAGDTGTMAGATFGRVVSFTIPSGTQVSSVSTGGMFRADEMAFDPKDRLLLVVNNADTPPFATLISVSTTCVLTVSKQIVYTTAASGVNATNGAEQSAWDPSTQRFYESIPSISGTTAVPGPMGALIRINPLTAMVDAIFSVPFCMPAGLSLRPTNLTFLQGCSVVYDTAGVPWFGADTNSANPSQVVIDVFGSFAFVNGVGSSDEVFYNAGDDHWYTGTSNSPYSAHPVAGTTGATSTTDQAAAILGVIDGASQSLDQIVPTINVPAVTGVHVSGSSHSVAVNYANNWVFVPHPANNAILGCLTGCIGVYGRDDADVTGDTD